jgi:hypothetical protein
MKRLLLAVVSMAMLGIGLTPSARADQWDKRTTLTVKETIQVPGKVLPPGVYIVKLLNSPSGRHIVQIFYENESEILTTIVAIPNNRLAPTDKSAFSFWEVPPGQPKALRAWFYPGDNFGQEFAYPKAEAIEIAAVAHAEVPATETEKPAELATAPVEKVEPPAVTAPAPAPAPIEVAEVSPSRVETPTLPKTASPYPMIGLFGVSALMISLLLRLMRTS